MKTHRQRGALSLFRVAILMACVGLAGMAALFAMRYQRNLLAETWDGLTRTSGAAEIAQKSQNAIETAKNEIRNGEATETGIMRKCMVDGKVMYSNVECKDKNPSSRNLNLPDYQGFEAPKIPAAPPADSAQPQNLQDKLIERATR